MVAAGGAPLSGGVLVGVSPPGTGVATLPGGAGGVGAGSVVVVLVVVVVVSPGGGSPNVIGAAIVTVCAKFAITMTQAKLPPSMHLRLLAPMPLVCTVYVVSAASFETGTRIVCVPRDSAP